MFGKTGGIQMKSVLKKEHSLICVTILSAMFGLTGCGGSDGESKFDITRPIESTLEITLDGIFTDSDEMTVEFDGEKAVIIDYGNSIFGTNPSVIPLGKPLIQDIRCNTQSCTGLLGVPSVSNGVLDRVRWEAVTLTPAKDDQITLESVSLIKYTLSPKKEENPKESELTATLTRKSSCKAWWSILSNDGAGRIWLQAWNYDAKGVRSPEPELKNNGWQINMVPALKFSGTNTVSSRHSYVSGERDESYLGDWKEFKVTAEDSDIYGCVFTAENTEQAFTFFAPHSIVDGELRVANSGIPVEGLDAPWNIVRDIAIRDYGEFFHGYKIIEK